MKKRFVFLFFLPLALSTLKAYSGVQGQDPELHRLISNGMDLTFQQRYDAADSVFHLLTKQFPDESVGYLKRAGIMQARAMDYEEEIERGPFDSLLALALAKSEGLLVLDPHSAWGYFWRASVLGYESHASSYRGDWFTAIRKAVSSVASFRQCVERDSSFYDAYVGIGTYLYWKSRKTQFLQWLPFVSDDRQEGIEMVRRCTEKGTYNRYTAIYSLISIYLDMESYSLAEETARVGLQRYPTNRFFLWGLAMALARAGKRVEAMEEYKSLLNALKSDKRANDYNEVVCRLNLVKLKVALNDTTDVGNHLQSILALQDGEFPDRLKDRVHQKFKEAKEIQRQLLSGSLH